jgi:hypothetical protein
MAATAALAWPQRRQMGLRGLDMGLVALVVVEAEHRQEHPHQVKMGATGIMDFY